MKLVQELPEIFEEFGEKRRKAFLEVKEYKDKGVPVVGMYCAYFPTELAMAVGAIPVGLCSFANETVMAAEKEMPKSMCPLVKSSYGFAIEDKCPFFHFADLVIGETTCDGKKKMYELMAEFKPMFVMELPNSPSDRGIEFWKNEILRTKEYFEEFFHVVITEERIIDAVRVNNAIRKSLKELCEVMKLEPAPVFGTDIQKIINGTKYRFDFRTTPEVVRAIKDKILDEYHQGKNQGRRPRILVTGCPIGGDTMAVLEEIENNGGIVVAVENCSGVKTLDQMVEQDTEDVYEAIAKRYLATGCSIMTPNDNRIELIGRIIDEYHVDGVVEMILSGCHATGAESIYIRKFANDEKGIPYIAIDTDYSLGNRGQMTTRLAAFVEMIQADKNGKESIDLSHCYKIALSGINEHLTFVDVLEEIWEYTKVPISFDSHKNGIIAKFGAENIDTENGENQIKCKLSEDLSLQLTVTTGKRKLQIQELATMLKKNYTMYQNSLEDECDKHEKENKKYPDFLWVLTSNGELTPRLVRHFKENGVEFDFEKQDDTAILFSYVKGKDDRNKIIHLCNTFSGGRDSIFIGNGFADKNKIDENLKLQRYVFEKVCEYDWPKKVFQIEEYYRELLIDCIDKKTEGYDIKLRELEIVKQEDFETGKKLYETLYWYLSMKRNVSQTATKLKIHRNTLIPRLTRLNELLNLDECSGEECEKLLLVMDIEKKKLR